MHQKCFIENEESEEHGQRKEISRAKDAILKPTNMSIAVTENLVDTLKVSLNPTIVTEVGNVEHADAILECFDGKRFVIVRRELALCSDFFK